ncbi:MAG: putative transrane protein [Candidatus Solibacter sp.]|jgi:predicted membrane protein|nr:putative transrane protein [Candidatus Solibacter sp.]
MERHEHGLHGFRGNPGIIPALAVIGVGVLFLLNNLNIFYLHDIWRFWPVALIAVGLAKLVDSQSDSDRTAGVVMTVVGAIFLTRNLGFLFVTWNDLWPLILIGAGVLMLWNRFYTPSPVPAGASPEGQFSIHAFFGGAERKVTTDDFRGGTASATFGGVELNFRKASMRADSAVVNVSAIFGGVEIKVPANWIVIAESSSVFGGFSDSSSHPDPDMPGVKRLYIRGSAIFGGVDIKN